MMVDWAQQCELPIHILLTKSDKLKRGAAQNTLLGIKKQLKDYPNASVQLFSSVTGTGIELARTTLTSWLELESAPDAEQEDPA